MRTYRRLMLAALVAVVVPAGVAVAQVVRGERAAQYFTNEQLDNLVAPIALYPDAILAQVLIAATFPDQIDDAARFVRSRGTRDIDTQNWDVSVKAVAHYPPLLNMLADRDDWTTALGQAYAAQSSDVMESVQHLRAMAREQGNLESTDQQNVIVENRHIRIVPAQPRVIYVPTYDPMVVFYRPIAYVGYRSSFWSFGIGFPIGAWLSYDCDWYADRVYYDGWRGGGWRVAAYPYIVVNTIYVHPRYEVVYVNRNVWGRDVDYGRFGRYNTVHRVVNWNERRPASPGPVPRYATNDGRRDDNRNGRDDRSTNAGRDDRSNAGRDNRTGTGRDDRGAQGRNDGRGAPSRADVPQPPITRSREPLTIRPPVVREREQTQPERTDVRRGGVITPRMSQPRVETATRAPQAERRSAPPASERHSAPPSRGGGNDRSAKKKN